MKIDDPTILKIANLTKDGFVKTSGGDGTLSVDSLGSFGPPGQDGLDADETLMIPGPPGTGIQGKPGISVYLETQEPDEPIVIPGPVGHIGLTGSSGQVIYLEPDLPDEPLMIPGPTGLTGSCEYFDGGNANTILDTETAIDGGAAGEVYAVDTFIDGGRA
jgi:hypothetical protein